MKNKKIEFKDFPWYSVDMLWWGNKVWELISYLKNKILNLISK